MADNTAVKRFLPAWAVAASLIAFILMLVAGYMLNAPGTRRNATDQRDDISGAQIHVMYVLPADGQDEKLDTNGTIAASLAAAQNWFATRADGRRLRFDTAGGKLDISFLRLSQSNEALAAHGLFIREEIQEAVRRAGFDARDKIYLVYYGGRGDTCGGSAWPPAVPGNVAALYLQGTPPDARPCRLNPMTRAGNEVGYWETSALHELLHSLGAVATCAPNHTRAGHVSDDPHDLMYAGDLPWEPSLLDVGHDDYFGHGRPDCIDIARSPYVGNPSEKPRVGK